MTLLKKGYEPKRVHEHHFVCFHKLALMFLGLHKKDLFALLLSCGQLHWLMEVVAIMIAEELHSMLHEFMHWHELRLLGSVKPTN
jgi:hypothetical protein